jgi:hypothetical protein
MLQPPSIRDLLAVITSFSLLSLYVTYQLGFSAGRLHTSDGGLAVGRQDATAYRDSHADSPFRSPQLLELLFKVSASDTSPASVEELSCRNNTSVTCETCFSPSSRYYVVHSTLKGVMGLLIMAVFRLIPVSYKPRDLSWLISTLSATLRLG